MLTDRRTEDGVIGILIAHLGAFSSGELINRFGEIKQYTKLSSVHVYCVCESNMSGTGIVCPIYTVILGGA